MPVCFHAQGEMSHITRTQCGGIVRAVFGDFHFTFKHVDEFIPAKGPLKFSRLARPQAAGNFLVITLGDDRAAGHGITFLDP